MTKQLVDNTNIQCRALKLRIYPTQEQEILINKTFGCCRKIYNIRIAEKQNFYNTVIKPEEDKEKRKNLWKTAKFSTEKDLKDQFDYLNEPSAQALQQSRIDAEKAYSNFLNSLTGKRKGRKVGLPKFQSKRDRNYSYRDCNPSKDALN
jgi:putative transposase